MNTLFKIAALSIITIGLSAPTYAAEATAVPATQDATTKTLTFAGASSGASLVFTPSANTLMVGTSTDLNYYIGSASSKTTTANGIEYAMVSGYNGYFQQPQTTDYKISDAGTAGARPAATWKSMGGGS